MDALRELVANFADHCVGRVSGELIFKEKEGEGATAKGVNLFLINAPFYNTLFTLPAVTITAISIDTAKKLC